MQILGQDLLLDKTPEVQGRLLLSSREEAWHAAVRRRAQAGNPFFSVVEGLFYYEGIGVNRDIDKAKELWASASQGGFGPAALALAQLHHANGMTPESINEAIRFYLEAGESGIPSAWYRLARLYNNGLQLSKEASKAVAYWKRGAEMGHAPSQYDLGIAYSEGSSAPLNRELGKYWLREAALKNHEGAKRYLLFKLQDERFARELSGATFGSTRAVQKEPLRRLAVLKELHDGNNVGTAEFTIALREILHLFPESAVGLRYGLARLQKLEMNTKGMGIDAIRLRFDEMRRPSTPRLQPPTPHRSSPVARAELKSSIVILYAFPSDVTIAPYLVPTSFSPRVWWNRYTVSDAIENAPWPAGYSAVMYRFSSDNIPLDQEHVLFLGFPDGDSVDMYCGVASFDKRREYNSKGTHNGFEYPLSHQEVMEGAFGLARTRSPAYLLDKAIDTGDADFVDQVLRQGAAVNGRPSLFLALWKTIPRDVSLVRRLLTAGAAPNRLGWNGQSPLHVICGKMRLVTPYQRSLDMTMADIVVELVRAGADINAQDGAGNTPLMEAYSAKAPPITIQKLLELGADPVARNRQGKTAIDIALENGVQLGIHAPK
jgi:hypothetical protein